MYVVGEKTGKVYDYDNIYSSGQATQNGDNIAAGKLFGRNWSQNSTYNNSSTVPINIKIPDFVVKILNLLKYYILINVIYFVSIPTFYASKIANQNYDGFVHFIPSWSHLLVKPFLMLMGILGNV